MYIYIHTLYVYIMCIYTCTITYTDTHIHIYTRVCACAYLLGWSLARSVQHSHPTNGRKRRPLTGEPVGTDSTYPVPHHYSHHQMLVKPDLMEV